MTTRRRLPVPLSEPSEPTGRRSVHTERELMRRAKRIRGERDLSRMAGERDTPRGRELDALVRSHDAHEDATRRSQRAIQGEMLRARASTPEASTYDRLRHRVFEATGMKKGGKVKAKKMAKGGSVSSASKRADGCAIKGKTKGRFV